MGSLPLGFALADGSDSDFGWFIPWSSQDLPGIGLRALGFVIYVLGIWLASKIVASRWKTGFRYALAVSIVQVLLGWLLWRAILPSTGNTLASLVVLLLVGFVSGVIIPAKVYGIGLLRAFFLSLLSICFIFLGTLVYLLLHDSGFEAARDKWQAIASMVKVAPGNPITPLPAPDLGPEIDGLLEAALHPRGPALPLAEREAIVRQLQDKLHATRNNLPSNDASAAAAYQNRFNRYMLVLNAVKAERQAQTARDAAASRPAASAPTPPAP